MIAIPTTVGVAVVVVGIVGTAVVVGVGIVAVIVVRGIAVVAVVVAVVVGW